MSLIEEAEAMGLVKRKPFADRPEYFQYPFDCNYDDLPQPYWYLARWGVEEARESGDHGSAADDNGNPTWECARHVYAYEASGSWQEKRYFWRFDLGYATTGHAGYRGAGALHINGCPDPRDIRYTPWTDCPECLKCGTGTMIIPDRYQAACRVLQCAACGTERIGTPLEWEHAKRAEVAWENELERQSAERGIAELNRKLENHPWNKKRTK